MSWSVDRYLSLLYLLISIVLNAVAVLGKNDCGDSGSVECGV